MGKLIKDIKPITATFTPLSCVDDLDVLVEEPCLAVCKDLYKKNIITIQSNGNIEGETSGEAWITFDTSTLDEENKKILNKLLDNKDENIIEINGRKLTISTGRNAGIRIPITLEDKVSEISNIFIKVTSNFKVQDLLANRTSFESLLIELYYNNIDNDIGVGMKKYMDAYDIWCAERGVPSEDLTYTYEDAIKFYGDVDSERGKQFVNDMVKHINEENQPGAVDMQDGIFFTSKNDLQRHEEWKKNINK